MAIAANFGNIALPRVKPGGKISAAVLNQYVDALNAYIARSRIGAERPVPAVSARERLPWDVSVARKKSGAVAGWNICLAPVFGVGATVTRFDPPKIFGEPILAKGQTECSSGQVWLFFTVDQAWREAEEVGNNLRTSALARSGDYADLAPVGYSRPPVDYRARSPLAGVAFVGFWSDYAAWTPEVAETVFGDEPLPDSVDRFGILLADCYWDAARKRGVVRKHISSPLFLPTWY